MASPIPPEPAAATAEGPPEIRPGQLDEDRRLGNRLAQAVADFDEVAKYLEQVERLRPKRPEDINDDVEQLHKALMTAAIVVYARPFVDSHSDNVALKRLDPVGFFDGEPELATFHKVVIDLRHQAVAHTDWEHHSNTLEGRTSEGKIAREVVQTAYRMLNDRLFWRLVEHVARRANVLSFRVDDRILRAEEALTNIQN